LNFELGAAAIAPAILLYIFTRAISPWVKRRNAANLKSTGSMSAEIQESLNNFKVIVAFNRRDYFRNRFKEVNDDNYKKAVSAGLANNIFLPVFGLSANLGQLIVLGFGIALIASGNFTLGLLISFLAYINNFYNPLRQLAMIWANLQVALAGWDRISQILALETDLPIVESKATEKSDAVVAFRDVSFSYPNGREVLHHINFELQHGKTYAFVGPTGGGKTTTASLMARLYDATQGQVLVNGVDIRSMQPNERASVIGFILQEPFLFTGTVRDNILYGNEPFSHFTNQELEKALEDAGLERLLMRFDGGLDTIINTSGDSISLGQRQLIAFMRAVLRKPQLLILDEATANIDTVTEQLLDEILQKLPVSTTRVIIAHRLNTIENADEIFFVNSGSVQRAGSFNDALNLLMDEKRVS
jgi:ATP-binding cassette subfamily B protein